MIAPADDLIARAIAAIELARDLSDTSRDIVKAVRTTLAHAPQSGDQLPK